MEGNVPSPIRSATSTEASRRRVLLTCLLAAGAVVVLGAGSTSAAATYGMGSPHDASRSGAALRPVVVNQAGSPATLDPATTCAFDDMPVIMNTYVRLVSYGTKRGPGGTTQFDPAKIVPYLAKSWTVSRNGLVYTFKLRRGLKFPSGRPVDARAVKYSFDRVTTMNQCGLYFLWDGLYKPPMIKSVSAPNATTVVIRLNKANPNALQDWAQAAGSIVDKSVVDAHGGVQKDKTNEWMTSHVAGSGPFILQSYSPNTRAVLVPNSRFTLPTNRAKRGVTINFIPSNSTLLLQARSGRADITLGMTKEAAASLRNNSCCRVYGFPTANSQQVYLSWKSPAPTARRQFRAALTYAVPYQQIVSSIAKGFGKLFYGPFPPSMPEYNAALSKPRPYNLARARQLLRQSGVQTPVTIRMIVRADQPVSQQLATILQGSWRQIGVNVDVQPLSSAQFVDALENARFEAAVQLDGPGVIEGGYYLRYDMQCGNPYNTTGMCMRNADALLAKAQRARTWPARKKIWNQLTKIWVANSPKVKIYADEAVVVLNRRVTGYFYSHLAEWRSLSVK